MCVHGKIVAGLVGAAMALEAVALAAFCYGRGRPDLERPAIVAVTGAHTSEPYYAGHDDVEYCVRWER